MADEAALRDLYRIVGQLEAQTRVSAEQRQQMIDTLGRIEAKLTTMATHEQRIVDVEGQAKEWTAMRNRGVGLLLGAAIAGGGGSLTIAKALGLLKGWWNS